MVKIKQAIFPIAGLGTRFFPITKTLPKEMLPLFDKPLLQYAIEEALSSGIEDFIFIVNQRQSLIKTYFENNPNLLPTKRIHYAYQEEPLGLGHAIYCARHFIQDEPFAVLLPDDVIVSNKTCLQQMVEAYKEIKSNIVAVEQVSPSNVSYYGIIKGKKIRGSSLIGIDSVVEKPHPEKTPSRLAIVGRYILSSRIFDFLKSQNPGTGGEIQLTDSLNPLLKEQLLYGMEFEGQRFDCGTKRGYLTAILKLALEKPNIKEEIESFLKREGFSRKISQSERAI
ncbi:MAG: UTP--glucose-1-phosphate uridylyltransferase [Alphaproteobacteria bacterium]|nr:UTP--glucose-1-phosphate uridylyltransferase [Alphaproteobacteria bacterium]